MSEHKHAVCTDCNREMKPGTPCKYNGLVDSEGKLWKRDTTNFAGEGKNCPDCNAPYGGAHHYGCDNERCPKCGRQLIGCDCWGDTVKLAVGVFQ